MIGKRTNQPKGNVGLAGLGQDPADMTSDRHPYLLGAKATPTPGGGAAKGWMSLALRKIRTSQLTPGGLSTAPEVKDALGDVRVPNVLQRMSGEMASTGEVGEGNPEFHSPAQPPNSGVVSAGNQPPGQLQASRQRGGKGLGAAAKELQMSSANPGASPNGSPAGAPTGFVPEAAAGANAGAPADNDILTGLAQLPHFARGGRLNAGMGIVGEKGPEELLALPGGGVQVTPLHGKAAKQAIRTTKMRHFNQGGELDPAGAPPDASAAATPQTVAAPSPSLADATIAPPNAQAPAPAKPNPMDALAGLPATPAAPPTTLTPPGSQTYNKDVLGALKPTPDLTSLTPPPQPARDRYNADVAKLAGLTPPDQNDPNLKAHGWQKALDVLAGIGTGALSMNPLVGVDTYKALAGQKYRQANQQYAENADALKNAVEAEKGPATLEQSGQNADQRAQDAQDKLSETQKNDAAKIAAAYRKQGLDAEGNPLPDEQLTPQELATRKVTEGHAALMAAQTEAQQAHSALMDAQQQAVANPNSPQFQLKLQQAQTAAKNAQSKLQGLTYAQIRGIISASEINPAIMELPGLGLSPHEISDLEAGLPRNPETGAPVGMHSVLAPTATTRTRGQQAQALLEQLPSLQSQISQLDAAGKLGPIAGRWNEFLTGQVGGNDPDVAAFRSNFATFVTGLAKAHLNTEKGIAEFENALGGAKSTGPNLLAALGPAQDVLKRYKAIGEGNPDKRPVGGPTGGGELTLDQIYKAADAHGISHGDALADALEHGFKVKK